MLMTKDATVHDFERVGTEVPQLLGNECMHSLTSFSAFSKIVLM